MEWVGKFATGVALFIGSLFGGGTATVTPPTATAPAQNPSLHTPTSVPNPLAQVSSGRANSFRVEAGIDKSSLIANSPHPVITGFASDLSSVNVGVSNLKPGCVLGDYFYKSQVPVVKGKWSIQVDTDLPPCDSYQVYVQIGTTTDPSDAEEIVLDDETLIVK